MKLRFFSYLYFCFHFREAENISRMSFKDWGRGGWWEGGGLEFSYMVGLPKMLGV